MTSPQSEEKSTKEEHCSTGKLLVYGSLMQGFFNYIKALDGQVVSCEPARIKGKLFHMKNKGYPALLPGDGWVYGELIDLVDFGKVLPQLDEIEHYFGAENPQNEYDRILSGVENLATGTVEHAYVYWYHAKDLNALENSADEIPSGDWRSYMQS